MSRYYGNLNNRLMEDSRQPVPEVGMGATLTGYTDRHAATVVKVTPSTVTVQQDKATRTDSSGMSDSQEWEYQPDASGRAITFRRNKHGQYVNRQCGYGLLLGVRDEHFDYSF